jgi:hypothetical protein
VTSHKGRDLALIGVSVAPFVYTLFDTSNGDMPLYHQVAGRLFAGAVPYRDWVFEYPPYALLWFLLPGLARGYVAFRALFSLQALAIDVATKLVLLREGRRVSSEGRGIGPFLVFSALAVFQTYFYLKRLDAIAGALFVLALIAFARDKVAAAGALLAVAAGTKLYPALAVPALFCLALERGKANRFLVGVGAALLPLAAASAFVPWWRFATFQAGRGLHVESTYGAIVWLFHFFGTPASWVSRPGCCLEVGGPSARVALTVARYLFALVTLCAVALSVASVWRPRDASVWRPREDRAAPRAELRMPGADFLGHLALLPIVAFMVSSIALSPQFAVWLIGPLALAAATSRRGATAALSVAIVLTTFVFPAPGYFSAEGISFGRTLVLVARNAALLIALVLLAREAAGRVVRRARRAPSGTVPGDA